MGRNRLGHTGWLVLLVLAALLALHELPDLSLFGHKLKRVDILSEVKRQTLKEDTDSRDAIHSVLSTSRQAQQTDSLTNQDAIYSLPTDSLPIKRTVESSSSICIEDYGDSTRRGMTRFYDSLDSLAVHPRPVRIAYFGDSFIEADILTADLREMLQKRFGGCGVGFVTITSKTNGFRPTVRHTFDGWQSHSVMDGKGFDHKKQGLSGHYFIPKTNAYVELKGQRGYATRLDTCQRASIYFYGKDTTTLSVRVNGGGTTTRTFRPMHDLQEMTVKGNIGAVRWTVERGDSALFYGLAMDGESGIILDNFSLRGSSGLTLRSIPTWMMREFNQQRPYDLILLQYGLNVATENRHNYDAYIAGMRTSVQHLKAAFPQAGILVVSVGDRDYKADDGELRTMPGIKSLVQSQQEMAADEAVAFWNLFEAMGGDDSMIELVESQPSMANYDYTHINFRGGKRLAGLLFEALMNGYERRNER